MKRIWVTSICICITLIIPLQGLDGEPTDAEDPVPDWIEEKSNVTDKIEITRIEIINIGADDFNGDGKIDLFTSNLEEWTFTFRIVSIDVENNETKPVSVGEVWINLTLGSQSNLTLLHPNETGIVALEFETLPLNTTDNMRWTYPDYRPYDNLTLRVDYLENNQYDRSAYIFHCTIHGSLDYDRNESPYHEYDYHTIMGIVFLIFLILLLIGIFGNKKIRSKLSDR